MGRKKIEFSKMGPKEIAQSLLRELPDLDPTDYLHLVYITRLGKVVDLIEDQACRRNFDISSADMRVLFALRRAKPPHALRPTELFRALLITSGAITKQVDRLSARGLVERLPDPVNKGGFLIHLSQPGLEIADKAFSALAGASEPETFPSGLTQAERKAMAALCERMLLEFEPLLENA